MDPLPFWLLATLLIAVLVVGRYVAGQTRRALARNGPWPERNHSQNETPSRPRESKAHRPPGRNHWLAARFARDRLTGLPLTLLTLLAVVMAALYAALVVALLAGSGIEQIDRQIDAAAELLRDAWFLRFFGYITKLADIQALAAITLVAAGFLWVHGRTSYISGLLVSVVGANATTYISKYVIARDRPEFETLASVATPSFPSGHATGAVAVYGFIVYAMARGLPSGKRRFELVYWGSVLILLIAASRLILGVHYSSDILAGAIIGAFWLIAGIAASFGDSILNYRKFR